MENDLPDFKGLTVEAAIAQLDEHAQLIGHVTVAWNRAQSIVFTLFAQLSKMPFDHARAVFFAVKVDFQQREMTQALANAALTDGQFANRALDKVNAALAEMNKLSSERNAVIHTIWDLPEAGKPIGAVADTKVFHPKYATDVGPQMSDLLDRISQTTQLLLDAFMAVLLHDASQSKQRAQSARPAAPESQVHQPSTANTPTDPP